MDNLISFYASMIRSECYLDKEGSSFIIKETGKSSSNSLLKVQVGSGCGFSLERLENLPKNSKVPKTPWGFLADNCLLGIKSVSDGIIVCQLNGRNYIILIDLKSENIGNAHKQLTSSFYLCGWLNQLIKLHHQSFDCNFVGIINYIKRKAPNKNGTRKGVKYNQFHICEHSNIPIFKIANIDKIYNEDIIQWLRTENLI